MKLFCAVLAWLCMGIGGTWISIRQKQSLDAAKAIGQGAIHLVHRLADGGLTMTQAMEPMLREQNVQGKWARWVMGRLRGEADDGSFERLDEKTKSMLLPPLTLYDTEHTLRLWQEEWKMLLKENEKQWQMKGLMAAKLGWVLGAGIMLMML